jgi:hypothetical protein
MVGLRDPGSRMILSFLQQTREHLFNDPVLRLWLSLRQISFRKDAIQPDVQSFAASNAHKSPAFIALIFDLNVII